jgi:hypothetical protein
VRSGSVTVAQHLPQQRVHVLGRDEGHVVGDHVHDEAHPVLPRGPGEVEEPLLATELVTDPGVVDDVVPVLRPGHGLEDRRQVEMGDPERGQVGDTGAGVGEGEAGVELETVGGGHRQTLPSWPVFNLVSRP